MKMKQVLAIFWGLSVAPFAFANQVTTSIHCRQLDQGTHEVTVIQKSQILPGDLGGKLSPPQMQALAGSESFYDYELTSFSGEATPVSVSAIGGEYDVSLMVVSADGRYRLTTFLDELSENDISSVLEIDGESFPMSCQSIEP